MAKITKHSEHVRCVRHAIQFDSKVTPGWGYSFECDKNGVLAPFTNPLAEANYRNALADPQFYAPYVSEQTWSYTEPAELRCDCGLLVVLHGFTSTCDRCHAEYNMSGQRLAPRALWGEETGETFGYSASLRLRA